MSIQHTISYAFNGQANLTYSVTETGNTEENLDISIPASTTNQLVPFIVKTLANLQSFFMVSDGALTVKADSSGTPEETFTLAAGQPVVYQAGTGQSNPFTSTLDTGLYVTNNGTAAVRLQIKALLQN